LSSSDLQHTLWQQGSVCCCLVTRQSPIRYSVQVCVNRIPFLFQNVADPDEGAQLAERFWPHFADARSAQPGTTSDKEPIIERTQHSDSEKIYLEERWGASQSQWLVWSRSDEPPRAFRSQAEALAFACPLADERHGSVWIRRGIATVKVYP
jgi:hypothetical protein